MKDNIQVIYEDNHLLAVNKPAGWLVQGDETGDAPISEWAKQYIKLRYNKPGEVFLGVIHRLDRPASGALLLARTSKALERMNALFKERKIEKIYWAIVRERPEPLQDRLVHYLEKDTEKNRTRVFDAPHPKHPGAKRAELSYRLIGSVGQDYLLEIKLETGRPHQIRAQLAKIGSPIVGDVKYGFPDGIRDGSICLHCRSMTFEHPVKKEPVTVTADIPDTDLWRRFRDVQVEG